MALSPRPMLNVAVEAWEPWTKVLTEADGSVRIEGPMANLLQVLSTLLNFDYQLLRPVDRLWGVPNQNGSWNGMLGHLQRQEVELAVGPFVISRQRETVCDFSVPLSSTKFVILMVRPTLQSDMAGFMKPLSGMVWLLALVSLAVVVLVMAWVAKTEVRLFGSSWRWDIARATIWGLKVFTQEGTTNVPPFDGSRLLASVWLLASLVFMSSYSGILTAMLTVSRVAIPIDSLADLVAQDDLPWKLEAGSFMLQYFRESEDEIGQRVFRGKSGTILNCYAPRQDIASGKYAAICDTSTTKKAMSWDFSTHGRCHLYMSKDVFRDLFISIAFRTKSKYLSEANLIILALKEAGIVDRWLDDQITNTSQCLRSPTKDRSDGISPLNIEDMAGCFLLLAAGLVSATVAFLLEEVVVYLPS